MVAPYRLLTAWAANTGVASVIAEVYTAFPPRSRTAIGGAIVQATVKGVALSSPLERTSASLPARFLKIFSYGADDRRLAAAHSDIHYAGSKWTSSS